LVGSGVTITGFGDGSKVSGVGLRDGIRVGHKLNGDRVGAGVTVTEGFGVLVGAGVTITGFGDGSKVGLNGDRVGAGVTVDEGFGVETVGKSEGFRLGHSVGNLVGNSVGESLGDEVGELDG